MYYVYKITNKINDKIYIGKTKNLEIRWKKHLQNSRNININKPFYNSIRKYGSENFSIEIISTYIDEEESYIGEIMWIKHYQSNDLTKGYNLSAGGRGNCGWHHTEKSKNHLKKYVVDGIIQKK